MEAITRRRVNERDRKLLYEEVVNCTTLSSSLFNYIYYSNRMKDEPLQAFAQTWTHFIRTKARITLSGDKFLCIEKRKKWLEIDHFMMIE